MPVPPPTHPPPFPFRSLRARAARTGFASRARRSGEYPLAFVPLQQTASVGALVLGASAVLRVIVMVQSARVGPVVRDADVWNLRETGQFTGEWQWFADRLEAASDRRSPGRDG